MNITSVITQIGKCLFVAINEKELGQFYRQMVRIRLFEERMMDLYFRGEVPGTIHLYIGQEAIATGVCANLRNDDVVVSTHRGHGHSIAKGVQLKRIAAEILGKVTGCCRGRGGTMHLSEPTAGLLYSSSIVGGGVPLAAGVGLAIKSKKTSNVAVCFFGDGASNTGGFHEGMNLASIWRLPVVFVCENNHYALSVSTEESTSVGRISTRASAYNMPGTTVDGNDVIAIHRAAKTAIDIARSKDGGPALIECETYRWTGHFAGDVQQPYRTKREVEEWKRRCPIKTLEKKLIKESILTESRIKKIYSEVQGEVEEAVRFAIDSPYPPNKELGEFVF
jgi:pyruvate dehydrogenase E1 component alpha subunit